MGEAKRRKKLDPNYGIVSNQNKASASNLKITLGKVAWLCYQQHGKGICAYRKNFPFSYVKSNKFIGASDLVFLEKYDPNKEFVLTHPIKDDAYLWSTGITSYLDDMAKARILIPKDTSLEDFLDQCLM